MPKFCWDTPPICEVIGAHLLNFKPISNPILKKIVRGTPVSIGKCASKTWYWSFSSACTNLEVQHPLRTEIWSAEKDALDEYNFTFSSQRLPDQSLPPLFCRMWEESWLINYLTNFKYLHPFQRYSPLNFEVVRNRAKFCMFLAPKNFSGRASQNFGLAI